MSDDWRTNTHPLTLQGPSGAGKTTVCRSLHELFPGPSVLFDIDEEPGFGVEVHDVEELRQALAAGETEIVVRTPDHVVENPELFPDVVRFMMELGNELRESGSGPVQFIIGEAQDVQEKWVKVAAKRLRKRHIKPLIETQDPFSLPTRIRTQARYQCWVSPPNDKQAESMENTNWPLAMLKELPMYDMLVFGRGWEALTRYRAPERFAE